MKRKTYFGLNKVVFTILFLLVSTSFSIAQISNTISEVKTSDARERQDLLIQASLVQSSGISEITLFYRAFGENEYTGRDMDLMGSYATYNIPGNEVIPPFIEYYIQINFTTGQKETYPMDYSTNEVPLKIPIQSVSPKDQEVLILSPDVNAKMKLEDFFVSISLLRASDDVNKQATKLYVDNYDITDMALFADDIILFQAVNFPITLTPGVHSLKVEIYDNKNNLYHSVSSSFEILPEDFKMIAKTDIKYNLTLQGESRNENLKGTSTWYNNVNIDFNASLSDWVLATRLYLTSEEKKYLQPNNRFLISLSSDWMNLAYGDNFPQFPSLILDGKRVRGVSASVQASYVKLQVAYGEVSRNVEGDFIQYITTNQMATNIITLADGQRAEINPGTFKRNLLSVRPSLVFDNTFQWGLSFLHGKDDVNSIQYGAKPQENLVLGTDFQLGLDDRKILLTAQAAFSLFNSDISTGTIGDDLIDSVSNSFNIDESLLRNLKNYLGPFFTVNQFMQPLNPQELSTFATEAALSLNYFNNYLKATYIYRGGDFQSFGQTYLRNDIAGINITDRLRLFENKLFLSIGYENLENNLQKTAFATTSFKTFNTSVSYFPRHDFPGIVVGYTNYAVSNGVDLLGKDSVKATDDLTNRYSVQLNYSFLYKVKHTTALSFFFSDRQDKSVYKNDVQNVSVLFSSNSYWTNYLMSNFNFGYTSSDMKTGQLNYFTFTLGGKYALLNDKLFLAASVNPTFGDFERRVVDMNVQYYIPQNFSIALQARYFNNKDFKDDTIIGLMTSYDLR